MKRLFGGGKQKDQPLQPPINPQQTPVQTPIHQQFATKGDDGGQWEIVEQHQHTPSLPPGASPPAPSPTARSPSPYSMTPSKQPLPPQTLRKKTPPVLGILSSLDPVQSQGHNRNISEENIPHSKDKEKKGGFWNRSGGGGDKDKEREREPAARERERELRDQSRGRRDEENELTRKIGFLTATASEDWTLVLDVCDHASSSEANAKEAVRALRREFKYGEPAAQLAAARLWAIMLRNSSETFINQSTSRKFLDTLEDLLTSTRTIPVVRERVMDVLAAAAYASGSKKDTGFRGLWRRVKPRDKPEEGMPFDTEDAMFNPPLLAVAASTVSPPPIVYHDATPIVPDTPPVSRPPPRKRKTSDNHPGADNNTNSKPHRSHRHQIIPPDEDMRRLFQECKIGVGNANLLTQALVVATPEQVNDPVIVEFHKKCKDSQELIFTQIPWASAGAERSRAAKDQEERERARTRKTSTTSLTPHNGSLTDLSQGAATQTREEELLADLLASNELLMEALKLYDDLKRVALEREVEDRSRGDTKMDPRLRQYIGEDGTLHAEAAGMGGSSSRSRSPSPAPTRTAIVPPVPTMQHPLPSHPQQQHSGEPVAFQPSPPPHAQSHGAQQSLAPPPAAPQGPRSPGMNSNLSRTPSPAHPDLQGALGVGEVVNGVGAMRVGGPREYAGQNGRPSIDDVSVTSHGHSHRGEYPASSHHGHGQSATAATASTTSGNAALTSNHSSSDSDLEDDERYGQQQYQPSAKALGKRRVEPETYGDDVGMGRRSSVENHFDDRPGGYDTDEEGEMTPERMWAARMHPATHYVYDAAAERTQARIRQGHVSALIVNGVH
ncbi:hypothetical protein R3P38DRAFT_2845741 [Favolaschia claudopus]|uniref:VHS domain-containing protein n=1 Tax=Favolaschia claudopus TaxID=2862362 RepID=A0AAW0DU25_9AGAR